MKKILVTTIAALVAAVTTYGQGTVNVAYSLGGANGVRVEGVLAAAAANARVEFLWAPVGTTDIAQFQVLGGLINVGTPTAGNFAGGTRTIPAGSGFTGIAPGAIVSVVVRGFTTGSGSSYDTAGVRGITGIFQVDTGNPLATPAPETAPNLNATFPGLNLVNQVPEPSSMALAGLGAASLLIFRRRK